MNRLLLPATLSALLALCALGCSVKAQTSQASKDPAYAFPHSPHVDGDVACLNCHASIASAEKLSGNARHVQLPENPAENKACSDCHDKNPELVVPVRTSPFRLRFNHKAHLERVKDCKTCHQKLPEPGDALLASPPMSACTSCHNHQADFNEARCTKCHLDLKSYRQPKSAFSHEGDWLRVHAQVAKTSAESCAACHDQTSCSECHAAQTVPVRASVIFPEAVDKTFIHRGDFVSRHQIEATANPASCRTCHGSAFCSSCHTEQGVTSTSVNVRDPHPKGWSTDKGTNHFHGDAARHDILSCAGCHDNGASSTCVGCHQVGGIGGNPHPTTFLRKHDGGDRSHNDMCRACHHGA